MKIMKLIELFKRQQLGSVDFLHLVERRIDDLLSFRFLLEPRKHFCLI